MRIPTGRAPGSLTLAIVGLLALAGCDGPQSALFPRGDAAARIDVLFRGMTVGGAVVLIAFVALMLYAAAERKREVSFRAAERLIVFGGVALPAVLLVVLLVYGLSQVSPLLARAPEGSLLVRVSGEQWWWRVEYEMPDGTRFELANEIRLPVGRPVQFELSSPDVIHSFWIPALGGKVDMIPGRTTQLALTPTSVGTLRGVCAEYCGDGHAWMAFPVVVQEAAEFEAWARLQEEPAPLAVIASEGGQAFIEQGCGACHAVRGSSDARIGPDLTHVGGRLSVGAGRFPSDAASLARWIAETDVAKPGVHMPAYRMLPDATIDALATYLGSLR